MNLGLYLHIPYCLHKCGYCDFNSHPENPEESVHYVDALLKELRSYAQKNTPPHQYLLGAVHLRSFCHRN